MCTYCARDIQRLQRSTAISKHTRLNGAIRASQLRVIDEQGNQIGVLSKEDALHEARIRELDLVEISPQANPPVAKIIDWGKYNYQKTKQIQKNKKASKASELKQMRFGLKISDHDMDVKLSKVFKFLESGHKVKLSVFFRGREITHKELGDALAQRIIEKLGDNVTVDQKPQMSGRQLSFVVRSNSNA